MKSGPRVLSIPEFLLDYVLVPEAEGGGPVGAARADLRAEVVRHRDRTMTVVFRDRIETMTRCEVCRTEDPPCTALRVLALPFADHPAYRAEWSISSSEGPEVVLAPDAGRTTWGHAHRRVLRLYGINVRET